MQYFGSNLTFNFDYCQLIFQMSSHSEVFKYSIPSVHKVKTSNSLRETCADLPDCVTESVCFCFLAGPFRDKGKQEVFKRPKISAHCVSQREQKAKVELHFPPKLFYSLSLCTKHVLLQHPLSLQPANGSRPQLPLNFTFATELSGNIAKTLPAPFEKCWYRCPETHTPTCPGHSRASRATMTALK